MSVTGRRHKVVVVASSYPPNIGGVERVAKTCASHLARRHDVQVFTTRSGTGDALRREVSDGVVVRRFAAVTLAHTPISPGIALRLSRLGKEHIVHVHVSGAFIPEVVLISSSLRRRPYIAHFHMDVDVYGRFGRLMKFYKRHVLGRFLRHAAAVIVLDGHQVDFLRDEYGVDRDRIRVIPNGVDSTFFLRSLEDLEQEQRTSEPVRFLYVGRLGAQKNPLRLVEAVAAVGARISLTMVGDGELRQEVAGRIAELHLENVQLVGASEGDDLLAWYRWAEVFVLPSDREGMPLVLLEAMAAGLPIVATNVPGTRDLLSGTGLLCDTDFRSLAAAIDEIARDAGLRYRLARRSVERAPNYTWDCNVAALERLYDSVAS